MSKRTCTRDQSHYIDTFAAAIVAVEPTLTNDRIAINNWISTGTTTPDMKKKLNILFEPYIENIKIDFKIPIWWSGFHTESSDKDSPLTDMISAALLIGGFSTMNIRLANPRIFEAQADFWACCKQLKDANSDNKNLIDPAKWGSAYSQQFTEQALSKSPDVLVYFFNKEDATQIKSTFFYKDEFPLLVNYSETYLITNSKPVNFYIFDIQTTIGHCDAVKELLFERMQELIPDKKKSIVFHCKSNSTLVKCSLELLKEIKPTNKLENKPATNPATKPANKPIVKQTKKSAAAANSITNKIDERGKRGGKRKRKSYKKKPHKKKVSYKKR